MEFQLSYFKSWKMMLWKCCSQYASKFGKLSSDHRSGKVSFHSNHKGRQCQKMSKLPHNCTPLTSCDESDTTEWLHFPFSLSCIGERNGNPLQCSCLENFEHYFTSVWDECNCPVVWAFFGIAFLWDWNENWPFPFLWPLLSFPNLLTCWLQHFHSIIFQDLK